MGEVVNLARYRRVISFRGYLRRERLEDHLAQSQGVDGPCEVEAAPESIQISRFKTRREFFELIAALEAKLNKLRGLGIDVEDCRENLESMQPRIEQFFAYCPETAAPFSPQLSQSMAILTPEQYEAKSELFQDLKSLLAAVNGLDPG